MNSTVRIPNLFVVNALRALIVLSEALCLVVQWALFPLSASVVQSAPETAPALWPYRIAGLLGILCVEVALASLWPLLTMVRRRDVFSGRAVRWVDLIIGAAAVEEVLMMLVLAAMLWWHPQTVDPETGVRFQASLGAPAPGFMVFMGILLDAAFILLMLVMRSLLVQATAQRDELETVI